MRHAPAVLVLTGLLGLLSSPVIAAGPHPGPRHPGLQLMDAFEIEHASDPRISPDGNRIVYVRNFADITHDRRQANLWILDSAGDGHRPLTTGLRHDTSPRWSPDGSRLAYVSSAEGSAQIHLRWMEGSETAVLTQLPRPPGDLSWSPDGRWLAFTMLVLETPAPLAKVPQPPAGAEWAPPVKVIQRTVYRADGAGYLENGYRHVFIVPAEGGTPRQLTSGPYHDDGPLSWVPDGSAILFTAKRQPHAELDPLNSEIHAVSISDGTLTALTDRTGPDHDGAVSPDGSRIAYLGFDDREQGYQVTRLYVMNRDGSQRRLLAAELDRDVESPQWAADSRSIYVQYDDTGDTSIARIGLDGTLQVVAQGVGGTSVGRPYSGGSFTVAGNGKIAFTLTGPQHPAEVAVAGSGKAGSPVLRLTALNDDLFAQRSLAGVEEITFPSSHDGRKIQAWVVRPTAAADGGKYPLILEIHGGPFANYGARFSTEMQLYAAAGYMVLYVNPRGSTSYGEEFGNLIHHNYPGEDYDDLMAGVDVLLKSGEVDADRLYVTGGSGGGVLTAWTVGKTGRFRGAVVGKPVINWYSFVLTADLPGFFYKYWFPGFPWDHAEHYMKRSPLSLVGNVTTPTMVLTGEADHRTPISESEQFYQALRLRQVDSVLVRVPEASHNIASRPSHLMSKVAHVLAWFDGHGGQGPAAAVEGR